MDGIHLIKQNSVAEMEEIVTRNVQQNLRPTLYGMSHEVMMELANELFSDSSLEEEAKIYIQILGSAGTSASTMVIVDIIEKVIGCNNDYGLAKAITEIPNNIAHCTEQLVEELINLFKKLKANPAW